MAGAFPIQVVFFGNDYFYSDHFFAAILENPKYTIVATVAPPPSVSTARSLPASLAEIARRATRPEPWRRLQVLHRLGWPWTGPMRRAVGPNGTAPATVEPWLRSVERLRIPLLRPRDVRAPDGDGWREIGALAAPDLFIAAGYTKILGGRILAIPRYGGYNFHPSRLPDYRGGSSVFFALRDGVQEIGLSCHRMRHAVDSGDIAYQQIMSVPRRARVEPTYRELVQRSLWMVDRLADDLQRSCVPVVRQSAGGSFHLAPKPCHMEIDWSRPALSVESMVYACDGHAVTRWHGAELFVVEGEAVAGATGAPPGSIVATDPDAITVACADGSALRITCIGFNVPLSRRGRLLLRAAEVADRLSIRSGDRFPCRSVAAPLKSNEG